jgi:2-polyprenyl-3-methyl-5-hydroxy-6-metoxy-1,4-benzoquinol methylase
MDKVKATFSFGRNWADYVNNFLTKEKLDLAKESFQRYLPEKEYKDRFLIDIGCGSGIFSFNALRVGCKKVVSFDADPISVETTGLVKKRFGGLLPQNYQWEIFNGSVLDPDLAAKFKGSADIVYSWGVLHHTGNMKLAIENAAGMVRPGGYFIIAIYNRAPSSEYWLKVKRFYNTSSRIVKIFLAYLFYFYVLLRRIGGYFVSLILGRPKPFRLGQLLERERGMSIFYDVIDWLGGYPYEYASVDEINDLVKKLGFELVSNPTKLASYPKKLFNRFTFSLTGCNEFVFKKYETR